MLFTKKRVNIKGSLDYLAWQKFKRNKFSLGGLFFILLIVAIAILGYLITPDKSPFANTQLLEIAAKKPGFSCTMLKVRKNEKENNRGFLYTMLMGRNNRYSYIPINSYHFENNDLIIEAFNDIEGEEPFYQEINPVDVVFPVAYGTKIKIDNNHFVFKDIDGNKKTISFGELKETIEQNHIETQKFLLGTDRFGRDLLSRLLIGARISISVGFISVFISLLIGITLGSVAGYFKGKVDDLIMWLINVIWSIPTLLMVIAITLVIGKGFWQIFIAVGLTMWVEVARVVRGQVLSVREKEYVEAARALGFGHARIIFKHILPNVFSPVIIISAANFATAILLEAGLSFLGI
ncbi:MAG: ABC transporter permease, partial [Bacteroidota bacterium]